MEEKNTLQIQDLPYRQLEGLGLDREALRSLPQEVTIPLRNGAVTPVIRGMLKTSNGNLYQIPLKLQVVRDENGQPQLMTYPLRREIDNSFRLSRDELSRVAKGEVLLRTITDREGNKKMKYLQLDPETRSMMSRDVATLRLTRLKDMEKIRDIELGLNQKEAIQDGKPVELAVGDQKVTVGVDLREPQGFKVVNGDMDEWKRQQQIRYDEAHPEFMGYVQTDRNRWEYRQVHVEQRTRAEESELSQKKNRGRTL